MARKFLTHVDLAKNELQNGVIQNLAAAPSSPVKGQLYMNSSDNTLYWWDGTSWQAAKAGAGVTFGTITQEQTFAATKVDGVATTAARSDHAHGNPVHDDGAHVGVHLNALAAPTGAVNMNNWPIQNLGTPSNATDATTKQYVDNAIGGLAWKDACRVATTANVTQSGTAAIDGVALTAGDRVLCKDQTTATQNGIWAAASGAWTRTTDADASGEMDGAAVFIMEGTANADKAFVCTTNGPIIPGSTATTWVQFGASTSYTAGGGLTLTGSTLDVGAGTGITVAADTVALDTTYTDGRYVLAANGVKRYAVDVGGATSQVITHNLGTSDIMVAVYRKASPFDEVDCDIEHTSTTTATLRFTVAPAAAEYRAVVLA